MVSAFFMPMSKQATQQRYQFHTTQQLGYKKILYCWCGASLDLNKNSYKALKQFKLAHEGVCEMPVESKQKVYGRVLTG
jgi:hypothetical protein